ncbi:hemicentin-1-like [Argopecten irradians]|uniref:hemicentin-1-like n=1 Tax=Argopecten irradians TaxID=31199 RepID=UPI00372260C6
MKTPVSHENTIQFRTQGTYLFSRERYTIQNQCLIWYLCYFFPNTLSLFRLYDEQRLSDPITVTVIDNTTELSAAFMSVSPHTAVFWSKDGGIIQQDIRHTLTVIPAKVSLESESGVKDDGFRASLVITELEPLDFGVYKVAVRNTFGISERIVHLTSKHFQLFKPMRCFQKMRQSRLSLTRLLVLRYNICILLPRHYQYMSLSNATALNLPARVNFYLARSVERETSNPVVPSSISWGYSDYIYSEFTYYRVICACGTSRNIDNTISYCINNDEIIMSVNFDSNIAYPTATWYHGDDRKSHNFNSNYTAILAISGYTLDGFGSYSVVLQNTAGKTSHVIDVITPEATCDQGETIQLVCNVTSCSDISLSWIHSVDNVVIRKLPGNQDGTINTLIIPTCIYSDAGIYTCVGADEETGSDVEINHYKTTLTVRCFDIQSHFKQVTPPIEPVYGNYKCIIRNDAGITELYIDLDFPNTELPILLSTPSTVEMNDDVITVSIHFDSNIAHPTISWYHNNVQVEASEQYRLTLDWNGMNSSDWLSSGYPLSESLLNISDTYQYPTLGSDRTSTHPNANYTATLTISKFTSEHFGSYRLFLKNLVGTTSHVIDISMPEVFPYATCDQGETIQLVCNVTSCSDVSLSWIHSVDDIVIRKLPGNQDGTINTLTIPTCMYSDAGTYTCVGIDKETGSAVVINHDKTTLTVRSIAVLLEPNVTIESRRILIEVPFFAKPSAHRITWYRNGERISPSKDDVIETEQRYVDAPVHGTINQFSGHMTSISVFSFTAQSFGTYKVTIMNEIGSSEQYIDVKNPKYDKGQGSAYKAMCNGD